MTEYQERVDSVRERISRAAERSGRSAEDITLVAVSKTKPIEAIQAAYEAGVRHFGENRSDELAEKQSQLAQLAQLTDLQWHFIGRLQTRQSKPVADYAACFHAIDRLKIAERLSTQLTSIERTLPSFVQVNISGEESKAGFDCTNWENSAEQKEALLKDIETIRQLPSFEVRGLMTMAPYDVTAEVAHDIFRRTRELSEWLHSTISDLNWPDLSMGMSGDFEVAIEEGSTCVRVGSAIFEAKQYK